MKWEDISDDGFSFGEMVSNVPRSAERFVGETVGAITSPVQTGKAIGGLAKSVGAKAERKLYEFLRDNLPESMAPPDIPQDEQSKLMAREQAADAMGGFLVDRYGSADAVLNTIEQDPVGFLADASMVLTAGGSTAARMPGMAGKVGKVVAKTGQLVDPTRIAAKTAGLTMKGAGKIAAPVVGDVMTGAGAESLKRAASAGYRGGDVADDFRRAMRGDIPMEEVVTQAKMALNNMRKARGEQYRSGMLDIAADKTVLDFAPIDEAVVGIKRIGTFKGKPISKSTAKVMDDIVATIDDWKRSAPEEFHTPEGMDALKKALGDIRDTTDFGSPSRTVADKAFNAVKTQITRQAPTYSRVMGDYGKGSQLIKEIEKSLSLGEKANIDTSLRKLQSIMRNNASTNYGQRAALVDELEAAGAANIQEKLAGQALNQLAPRGLSKAVAGGIGGAGAMTMNPAAIVPLAATSPRLAGEVAFYGGKASGAMRDLNKLLKTTGATTPGIVSAAFQAGRTETESQPDVLKWEDL